MRKVLAAAAVALLCAGSVQAGTIVQSFSAGSRSLAAFDQYSGSETLLSVVFDYSLTTSLSGIALFDPPATGRNPQITVTATNNAFFYVESFTVGHSVDGSLGALPPSATQGCLPYSCYAETTISDTYSSDNLSVYVGTGQLYIDQIGAQLYADVVDEDGAKGYLVDQRPGGSISGTVTYTFGAVPEPSTWAMMIAGFGLCGSALRTRSRANRLV